jgi:uncharacterized protein (TIGR03435 family)
LPGDRRPRNDRDERLEPANANLHGLFRLKLQWNADAPALPTALREQLGLRLDSTTEPLDVLVIDHIARPTDN